MFWTSSVYLYTLSHYHTWIDIQVYLVWVSETGALGSLGRTATGVAFGRFLFSHASKMLVYHGGKLLKFFGKI